ncbi:MAG TPA: cohesin domain-containing protein [archaeon]|nr:cohesin domain-containing protein [archaeon]
MCLKKTTAVLCAMFMFFISGLLFGQEVAGEIALPLDDATPQDSSTNKLKVTDAAASSGSDVVVKVQATTDKDFIGVLFDLLFDVTKLQIKNVKAGTDSAGLILVGVDSSAISRANSSGKIGVSFIDLNLSNPVAAGTDRELLVVTFTAVEGAEGEVAVTLDNVSVSDDKAQEIVFALEGGTVTITAGITGDVNGSGSVDIFDLLQLLKVLGGTSEVSAASDVNQSGSTDIFDLLALLKLLAGS